MALDTVPIGTAIEDGSGTLTRTWFKWFNAVRAAVNDPLTPVAFANLPADPQEGMLRVITDSSVTAWQATIAGGGANRVLGYYNGSSWTVAAR